MRKVRTLPKLLLLVLLSSLDVHQESLSQEFFQSGILNVTIAGVNDSVYISGSSWKGPPSRWIRSIPICAPC